MLGKQKCKILKEIRQRIADENDIPYVTSECTHKGACKGTCPKCESELRYLEQQLALRQSMGKRVAVAALCAGLAFGALIPCMLDLGCREVPESSMLATTALALSLYLGQIVAPPLIGALESAVSLHAGIALCGVFMLLTSLCCRVAPLRGE